MTHSNSDPAASGDDARASLSGYVESGSASPTTSGDASGPDPVIGAGFTLFGIFVMAVGGARDLHYVFDAGVAVAMIGAVVFVLFVALSAMKQRRRGTS